jgi:NAD(P) transhydrogenase subunit alpha
MVRCRKHFLLALAFTAAFAVGGCGHAQKTTDTSESADKPAANAPANDSESKPADVPKPETSAAEPNPSTATADTAVKSADTTTATLPTSETSKGTDSVPAPREPAAPSTEEPKRETDYSSLLFVFMLATFIGLGVILRVSRLLHTPLMSLTNAISAIAVVGSIIVVGGENHPTPIRIIGAIALFASMTNIISGFLITDRMLKMFKSPGEGGKR